MPNRPVLPIRALAGAGVSLALCGALWAGFVARADARTDVLAQPPAPTITSVMNATPTRETYTLTYFNRPIVVLKAIVLGRTPMERAQAAVDAIEDLVSQHVRGPVTARPFDGGELISVGTRVVLVLTPPDVDSLSGDTLDGSSARAVERLQQALAEEGEAGSVSSVLRSTVIALIGILVGLAAFWITGRAQQIIKGKFVAAAEKKVASSTIADLEMLRGLHLVDFERGVVTTSKVALDLVLVYWVLTFVLRQFPYTRPWGESLRGFLCDSP